MERCLFNDDSKRAPEKAIDQLVDIGDAALNANCLFKLTRWRLVGGGINTPISGLAQMCHLSLVEAMLTLL